MTTASELYETLWPDLADVQRRESEKRERLRAEAKAAHARYPDPHPDEVQAMKKAHKNIADEADALMNVRMNALYPLGYKDVDLMTAWERLPSEVSEELNRDMAKEEGLRDLTHVLNGFLIYTDRYGGIDPRHVTEAWAAIGRMMPVITPEPVGVPELEWRPEPIPEVEQALLSSEYTVPIKMPPAGSIIVEREGKKYAAKLDEYGGIWRGGEKIGQYNPRTGELEEVVAYKQSLEYYDKWGRLQTATLFPADMSLWEEGELIGFYDEESNAVVPLFPARLEVEIKDDIVEVEVRKEDEEYPVYRVDTDEKIGTYDPETRQITTELPLWKKVLTNIIGPLVYPQEMVLKYFNVITTKTAEDITPEEKDFVDLFGSEVLGSTEEDITDAQEEADSILAEWKAQGSPRAPSGRPILPYRLPDFSKLSRQIIQIPKAFKELFAPSDELKQAYHTLAATKGFIGPFAKEELALTVVNPLWYLLPSAIAVRASLATVAAGRGVVGIAAKTTRAALLPVEIAERGVGLGLKYGLVWPVRQVAVKGVAPVLRKSFEVALDAGLDRWLVRQGIRGDQANRVVQFFMTKNKNWLFEQGKKNLLKRKAQRMGTTDQVAKAAADDTIREAEPLLLAASKEIGVIKPTPEVVKPRVSPPVLKNIARRAEIKTLLATPIKQLPKGTSKIALRKELSEINAKLVPGEKKLRQQIMAEVKTLGLPESQYREIFRNIGGSRWLSQVTMEKLPRVLQVMKATRPKSIKGKKVITLKTEQDLLVRKGELIEEGILTEETYKDILKALKLSTDKYTSKELFITESEAHSILKEMNNRAILAPLGELKFAKPTAVKFLTSDIYYGQVLGVHPLVEPLELAKVDFDLAYRAMARAVDQQINKVNKAWDVSARERLLAKTEGRPTRAITKLRDLLDKFEEAPAELTKSQTVVFNWFRNLNRTIISGENEVRRGLGMPEIAYREAYVRHIPDFMAEEILQGLHPLPPSLEYWSRRIVSKKIFNPMEFRRQLSDDLAKLYTKDLAQATRNMVYTGLKEIHLAQPLKAFTERMGALSDVMPASTKKWVVDFVNQRIKGQQTEWDAGLNRLVTESGFGGLINNVLRPYRLSLGTQPVTRLAQLIGRGTILAVLGLPRPKLLRLLIRNLFQRTQELALHSPIAVIKGFAFEKGKLKELMDESRFLRAYTGVEELPQDLASKLEKMALAPYQFTAVVNARQAMRTTYHDILSFFTKPRYKDLGWASPKRTYTEPEGFLYPEEETIMLAEMELAGRATQYQYIGLGMPGIFRNKSLIPLTRLQSWWMNHFFMFHREAAHRFLYGETRLGHKLPWTKRVNYLTYLLLGGAILTSMGYGMSYLWRVLPHNLSPVGQFMTGLLTYVGADTDWEREKGKREIFSAWKAMVPGPLAYDEFEKFWSGERPLWQMFFYGREEEGIPPRLPTWGIVSNEPSLTIKGAITDVTEAEGQLGLTVPKELPDPYYYIDQETGEYRLYTPPEEEYVYTTVDLGAAIRRATLKLEDKEITAENGFSPLTLMYKEAELYWSHYYYSLPASERGSFREQPQNANVEAYLFLWGKVTTLRCRDAEGNSLSEPIVRAWMAEYNILVEAVPALSKIEEEEGIPRVQPSIGAS